MYQLQPGSIVLYVSVHFREPPNAKNWIMLQKCFTWLFTGGRKEGDLTVRVREQDANSQTGSNIHFAEGHSLAASDSAAPFGPLANQDSLNSAIERNVLHHKLTRDHFKMFPSEGRAQASPCLEIGSSAGHGIRLQGFSGFAVGKDNRLLNYMGRKGSDPLRNAPGSSMKNTKGAFRSHPMRRSRTVSTWEPPHVQNWGTLVSTNLDRLKTDRWDSRCSIQRLLPSRKRQKPVAGFQKNAGWIFWLKGRLKW
jgi:hypothetical protein